MDKEKQNSLNIFAILFKSVFPSTVSFMFFNFSEHTKSILEVFHQIPIFKRINQPTLNITFKIFAWMVMGFVIKNLVNYLIWDFLYPLFSKRAIPRIFRLVSNYLIYFSISVIALNAILALKITDVLTTAGFIVVILFFALRPILTDLYGGVALNLEKSFRIGEWVMIRQKGISGMTIGCVKEITWRTTRILTPENSYVIIPNSELITSSITNLTSHNPVSEFEMEICVDYSTNIDLVEEVLATSLNEAIENNGPLANPAPKARIKNIDINGIHFKITYMVDPVIASKSKVRHIIYKSILKHFKFNGIDPSVNKQEIVIDKINNHPNLDKIYTEIKL